MPVFTRAQIFSDEGYGRYHMSLPIRLGEEIREQRKRQRIWVIGGVLQLEVRRPCA